jgi:hypothetical protein
MRIAVFAFWLACTLGCYGCAHTNAGPKARSTSSAGSGATKSAAVANSSAETAPTNSFAKPATDSATAPAKVDFPTQIRPLLEAKCQPCHFNGGKVYQRMPFDRPETIKTLGTKLFTRIKDENERRLIRDFLAQE